MHLLTKITKKYGNTSYLAIGQVQKASCMKGIYRGSFERISQSGAKLL